MTRDDFIARILGSASTADFLYNLREGLDKMDIKDEDGNPLTSDMILVDGYLEPQAYDIPEIKISITLKTFTLRCQGAEIVFPTKAVCSLVRTLEEVHDDYHKTVLAVVTQALASLTTEQEKILAQLLSDNPPQLN